MTITIELMTEIAEVLAKHNSNWNELRSMYVTDPTDPNGGAKHPAPSAAAVALSQPAPKSDVDAAWVKASAEAILKANIRMTPNAQSFVAQTFARANQYPTVKFSPKQWEWFNKLMLDAGVESLELPS